MKSIFARLALVSLAYGNPVDKNDQLATNNVILEKSNISKAVDNSYPEIESRIIGGQAAKQGMFSWQAAILNMQCHQPILWNYCVPNELESYCGASLISQFYLVTAAHCIKLFRQGVTIITTKMDVKLGSTDRLRDGTEVPARNFFHHPNYNMITTEHDIGIVEMSIPYTSYKFYSPAHIAPISLPSQADIWATNNFDGYYAFASGYGTNDDYGEYNTQLNFVSMQVLSNLECRRQDNLYGYMYDSVICTSNLGNKSGCNGDSGGPLAIVRKDTTNSGYNCDYILIGVTSRAAGANCKSASVFTSIAHHMDFIHSYITNV